MACSNYIIIFSKNSVNTPILEGVELISKVSPLVKPKLNNGIIKVPFFQYNLKNYQLLILDLIKLHLI